MDYTVVFSVNKALVLPDAVFINPSEYKVAVIAYQLKFISKPTLKLIPIFCSLIKQNSYFDGHWRPVLDYVFTKPMSLTQDEAKIANPIYFPVVNVDNPSISFNAPTESGCVLLHFRHVKFF